MADYFLHPRALCDAEAVGAGTRIWAFAHLMAGARVGRDCNIGECVFVETGVTLGDRVTVKNGVQLWTGVTCEDEVFIGPNATFTNDLRPRVAHPLDPADFVPTLVRRGASIGANATLRAGIEIGALAMIGAGAVVLTDVPPHGLVVGNPARRIGWACSCGAKLEELVCPACGLVYERLDSGLRPVGG